MAKWPNHFISDKKYQTWMIWPFIAPNGSHDGNGVKLIHARLMTEILILQSCNAANVQ